MRDTEVKSEHLCIYSPLSHPAMFSNSISEQIVTAAWEQGVITREDLNLLLYNITDENTYYIAARLLHAIRRGRMTVLDVPIAA